MSDRDLPVSCRNHGSTPSTYVCRHLARDSGRGYFPAFEPDEEDPWPDAWCGDCEKMFLERGEWTESAMEMAAVAVLCTHCYEAARERNQLA